MTPWNRLASLLMASATVGLAAPQLTAALIGWQGGAGNLTDANYSTDGTTQNLAPAAGDRLNFGNAGTGTLSTGNTHSFQRLYVGGSGNVPNPAAPPANIALPRGGAGTLTVNNGSKINLTAGAAGSDNAGLTVGRVQNGTLNIDGADSSVTSNQLIVIGYAGGQPTRSGTVNITNGGSLISTAGNINMGDSPAAGDVGMQGHLFVSGVGSLVQATGAGADLNIGIRNTTSSVTQSGGAINIADVIEVGFGGTGAHTNLNSSFNISGGTTTNGGNFFVGRGASAGATVNITGGTINVGNLYLMGSGTATGVVTNHSAGTLNVATSVRVADAGTTSASTYNLSGAGIINSNSTTSPSIVGRQGTGKLFQTGGTANFNGSLSIGNREAAANPTNGLYKISAGDLNVFTALNVAPKGIGELRVVGDDATIDVTGDFSLGNTVDGLGTLAYELETGDLLSVINVTGTATFALGSSLVFDVSNASPTQDVYDVLTAVDIIDGGIAFSGPFPWLYRIIPGGNGEILQIIIPEPGALSLALLAGVVILRRRCRA